MASRMTALTPALRSRLNAVKRRIRLQRIARGLSLAALLLLLAGTTALLADYLLALPASVRLALFAGWVLLGGTTLLAGLIIPLFRRLDPSDLAAAIEQKYPQLAERLTTSVELAGRQDEYHGSPALIALLVSDTAQETAHLNFLTAVSARGTIALGVATATVFIVALTPAFVWTREYVHLSQRFFCAWITPTNIVPIHEDAQTSAPIELAEDSPVLTITPPPYAREALLEESLKGIVDLSALQHSDVKFDVRFTQPTVAAFLEWTAGEIKEPKEGSKTALSVRLVPLTLSEDRRSATGTIVALANGSFQLVVEAEGGKRTTFAAQTLTVHPDQPPRLFKFTGKEEELTIPAYDRLPLEISISDDIGVARADLEYTVSNGDAKIEAMTLTGLNRQEMTAKHVFQLASKVKEGDEVRYRLRIQDNRPQEYGGPNTTYYPAERWLLLKVARNATPLGEQEIMAQRDNFAQRLDTILADLRREQRGIYKIRQEARPNPALTADQMKDLEKLQQANRATENALREWVREVNTVPALEQLAEKGQEIADHEIRQSEEALRDAARESQSSQRDADFQNADQALTSALQKLEELAKANDKLAQNRLDHQKLQTLADREKQLAERAAELAAKDPVRDLAAKQEAKVVQRDQADVAAELQRLGEKSETLHNALDQAHAEQAKMLAEQAKKLATAQRELAKPAKETKDPNAQRAQQQLQEQTDQLAQDLSKLGQQMSRVPPAAQAAQQASHLAQQAQKAMQQARDQQNLGNHTAAQQAQQNAAQALDQAAQQASQAAQRQAMNQPVNPQQAMPSDRSLAGQGMRQAQSQMEQAQRKLNQGQPQGAQAAMQRAAQALQQTAQQMAALSAKQPTQGKRPNDSGASSGGLPDPSLFGPDMQKYAGKAWGELPGELRTKIMQDMKVKYGDDYARMIKLYFEQIADTKSK